MSRRRRQVKKPRDAGFHSGIKSFKNIHYPVIHTGICEISLHVFKSGKKFCPNGAVEHLPNRIMGCPCHEFCKLVDGNLSSAYTDKIDGRIKLSLFRQIIQCRHDFAVDEVPGRAKDDEYKWSHRCLLLVGSYDDEKIRAHRLGFSCGKG